MALQVLQVLYYRYCTGCTVQGTVQGGPAGTTGTTGTTGTVQGGLGGPGQVDGAEGSVREDSTQPGIACLDIVAWDRKRKGQDDIVSSNPGILITNSYILAEW